VCPKTSNLDFVLETRIPFHLGFRETAQSTLGVLTEAQPRDRGDDNFARQFGREREEVMIMVGSFVDHELFGEFTWQSLLQGATPTHT
jgi:hypothetical protein